MHMRPRKCTFTPGVCRSRYSLFYSVLLTRHVCKATSKALHKRMTTPMSTASRQHARARQHPPLRHPERAQRVEGSTCSNNPLIGQTCKRFASSCRSFDSVQSLRSFTPLRMTCDLHILIVTPRRHPERSEHPQGANEVVRIYAHKQTACASFTTSKHNLI